MSVDGIWYVKLADGDVERVTLDQLDEAFQKGQIDETCMVLADGAQQWTKLADLLGLSEAPAPAAPTPAAVSPRTPVQSPVAARSPFAMPPLAAPHAAATQRPVAAQAPLGMPPPHAMPAIPVASSLRPVSLDLSSQANLGDLQYPQYPTPSRKRWVVGGLGTALVVGAGAFFVVARTPSSVPPPNEAPVFAAAAAPDPAPAPAQPATPTPPSAQQAMNPGPSSVMDPTQRLTDDQKKKLLEAEKNKSHAKSHAGAVVAGGGGGGGTHHREKSTGFTTDGNKFDPLNSSL
jgi:hypothetical protein